jgi:hypothetical protein
MTCTEKHFCPDGGIKCSLVWYETVVLLGMQISVKMGLLINHVEVVVLLWINPQLMYSTVISVEKSSWTKPNLLHTLSNMLVPHWSRCFFKVLWFSSYLWNMYMVLLDFVVKCWSWLILSVFALCQWFYQVFISIDIIIDITHHSYLAHDFKGASRAITWSWINKEVICSDCS